MNKFTFALVILIGFLVVSRFIAEAGIKKLSTEQKGHLVETMTPFRKIWSNFMDYFGSSCLR